MQTVELVVLGKKYYLKSDNPEKLKEFARQLENSLEELNQRFNTVDQTKLYLLHTLQLMERCLELNKQNDELRCQFERIGDLFKDIESEF
ncbi:MAG: cell division protein ZapA [Candidatus Cloacimonetes bacterium]|nr:cell division protein ZapA [Candidatus Cloacimonadota bacterium]